MQKTENVYEMGCDRGAIHLVAKLSDRPVNKEPRCREVAGFFRFREYWQGFTNDRRAAIPWERTIEGAGLIVILDVDSHSAEGLSDSLPEKGDPVNNPVAFGPPKRTLL